MRNQIFHSPGNEEAELAKILGDGDPPPPHGISKLEQPRKMFEYSFVHQHTTVLNLNY